MPADTLCSAIDKNGRPCRWRRLDDSEFCRNHDPRLAEERRRAGARRHPRFVRTLTVGGQDFDRAKSPTIALIVDKLLDVDRELEELVNVAARDVVAAAAKNDANPLDTIDLLEAKRAMLGGIAKVYAVRVAALTKAREALFDERDFATRQSADGAPMLPASPGLSLEQELEQ